MQVDYIKQFGEVAGFFEERFEIPKTLTVYNQFDDDSCTGFASATAAEIIWGKRFSAGWLLSQSKLENQRGEGRFLVKVLEAMCSIGAVPLADFGILAYCEEIFDAVKDNPHLLNIASMYKADGYCNLLYADKTKRDKCIKDAVSKWDEGVAVLATSNRYFGKNHCICLTGWNDETGSYIFQNSTGKKYGTNGRGEIPKDRLDGVYAVFKKDVSMPFTDIDADGWSYDDLKFAYDLGLINGTSETKFSPNKNITREEVGAMLGRLAGYVVETIERKLLLDHQKEI